MREVSRGDVVHLAQAEIHSEHYLASGAAYLGENRQRVYEPLFSGSPRAMAAFAWLEESLGAVTFHSRAILDLSCRDFVELPPARMRTFEFTGGIYKSRTPDMAYFPLVQMMVLWFPVDFPLSGSANGGTFFGFPFTPNRGPPLNHKPLQAQHREPCATQAACSADGRTGNRAIGRSLGFHKSRGRRIKRADIHTHCRWSTYYPLNLSPVMGHMKGRRTGSLLQVGAELFSQLPFLWATCFDYLL